MAVTPAGDAITPVEAEAESVVVRTRGRRLPAPTADPGKHAAPSTDFDMPLRLAAKTDYAIRALTEIAASGPKPITAHRISHAQAIPQGFLLNILGELRRAGLVRSRRGSAPGYELARPATQITIGEIIAVIQRDLSRPAIEEVTYRGAAGPLRDLWLAVRSSLSSVLGSVTLADVASGELPQAIQTLARQAEAADSRPAAHQRRTDAPRSPVGLQPARPHTRAT